MTTCSWNTSTITKKRITLSKTSLRASSLTSIKKVTVLFSNAWTFLKKTAPLSRNNSKNSVIVTQLIIISWSDWLKVKDTENSSNTICASMLCNGWFKARWTINLLTWLQYSFPSDASLTLKCCKKSLPTENDVRERLWWKEKKL